MDRSEAARLGWETRRAHLRGFADYREMIQAQHRAEAELSWSKMSPEARKTAVARGWGAHLPPKHRREITKR